MKFIKPIALSFFIISYFNLPAQKVKDNLIRFTYENMPTEDLPVGYQNYKIKTHFNEGDNGFSTFNAWTFFFLSGYNLKAEGADIVFELNIGALELLDKKVKRVEEEDPITKGKINVYFYYNVWYTLPLTLTAKNSDGKVLYEKVFSNNETIEELFPIANYPDPVTQKKYTAIPDLETAFTFQKMHGYQDIRKNRATQNLKAIQPLLNEKFGFEKKSTAFNFYYGKGKQFDYSALDSSIAFMEDALGMITKNTKEKTRKNWHQEEIKKLTEKSVVIWEKALTENKPGQKDQKIPDELVIGLRQNLMYGYFLLDDYEKAKKLGSEILNNPLFSRLENMSIRLFLDEVVPKQEEWYKKYKGKYF